MLVCDSARLAAHILAAARAGSLAALETELKQAATVPPPELAPDGAERWELLAAVSAALRAGIERLRRRAAGRLEGAEVQLGLLRHLAAPYLSRSRIEASSWRTCCQAAEE